MKVELKSGFTCEVDENKVDDWDFLDYLVMCDDDDTIVKGVKLAIPYLLGKEGEAALKEFLRKPDGRVPASEMIITFKEILNQIKEFNNTKKSSPSQV